jgi:uncharacterized membrane protein
MAKEKIRNVLFLILSTFLGALGQLLFKYSFQVPAFILFLSLGLISYFASTIVYFYVLSRVHLSWAYSLGGLSYIFAVILAATILAESVPPLRWIGVSIIFIGVLLIGLT